MHLGSNHVGSEVSTNFFIGTSTHQCRNGTPCTGSRNDMRETVTFHQSIQVSKMIASHGSSSRKTECCPSVRRFGRLEKFLKLMNVMLALFATSLGSSRIVTTIATTIWTLFIMMTAAIIAAIARTAIGLAIFLFWFGIKVQCGPTDNRFPNLVTLVPCLLIELFIVFGNRGCGRRTGGRCSLALLFHNTTIQGIIGDPMQGGRHLVNEFRYNILWLSRVGVGKEILAHDTTDIFASALSQDGQGQEGILSLSGILQVSNQLLDELPIVNIAGSFIIVFLPVVSLLGQVQSSSVLVPIGIGLCLSHLSA
mmetsp:Transcript_33071/g.79925  ORF Transcript_33071/g.79925 Transcript_33071/m.79925 type:complete len:309 (+) Transcript_33071:1268-2194(+)